jgi:hypothetical protein
MGISQLTGAITSWQAGLDTYTLPRKGLAMGAGLTTRMINEASGSSRIESQQNQRYLPTSATT